MHPGVKALLDLDSKIILVFTITVIYPHYKGMVNIAPKVVFVSAVFPAKAVPV